MSTGDRQQEAVPVTASRRAIINPRAAWRTTRAHLLGWAWWRWLMVAGVSSGLLGTLMWSSGSPEALTVAAVTFGVVLAGAVLVHVPAVGGSFLVVLLYLSVMTPLAVLYVGAPTAGVGVTDGNAGAGAVSLLLLAVVVVWVAVKLSTGRAWVTTAITLAATALIGPVLVLGFPQLGLYAAYLSTAVALFVRCGGPRWVKTLAWRRGAPAVDGYVEAQWVAVGRRHDVVVPVVLVGRFGVVLGEQVTLTGPVTENTRDGVHLPGVDLPGVVERLKAARGPAGRVLGVRPTATHLVVLVASADPVPGLPRRLDVFTEGDGKLPSGSVHLVAAGDKDRWLLDLKPQVSAAHAAGVARRVGSLSRKKGH
jgi:hypothetical protein